MAAELTPKDRMNIEETNRWWQAFCATVNGRNIGLADENLEALAKTYADFADALVSEARKRGRLL